MSEARSTTVRTIARCPKCKPSKTPSVNTVGRWISACSIPAKIFIGCECSMDDNCGFSSPLLIRKPLRRIHNLIYFVFQLSDLFGHFRPSTPVVVTNRLRFPINPDGGERCRVISPVLSAHTRIIHIVIFQREEFHSVKLRHQPFELVPGNDAPYRHPFLLNKTTPFKYNRPVGGDRQFVI